MPKELSLKQKLIILGCFMAAASFVAGLAFNVALYAISRKVAGILDVDFSNIDAITGWLSEVGRYVRYGQAASISLSVAAIVAALTAAYLAAKSITSQLGAIVQRLNTSAAEVGAATGQVAEATKSLSKNTSEQAMAVQSTVSAADQISTMVAKNAENASVSKNISQASEQSTQRGQQALEDVLRAISEVRTSNAEIMSRVENGNREIASVVDVISKIGEKTKVINDIVFQTKLLSFNASVEAARAGEAGKGFAVVAEEVGNLAANSGRAAQEISALLESSIETVKNTVEKTRAEVERLISSGKSTVEAAVVTSERCREVFGEILKNVSDVNAIVADISQSSEEQSKGVREVSSAMSNLDKTIQEITSGAQKLDGTADYLSKQVDHLHSISSALVASIEGTATGRGKDHKALHELRSNAR